MDKLRDLKNGRKQVKNKPLFNTIQNDDESFEPPKLGEPVPTIQSTNAKSKGLVLQLKIKKINQKK